MGKGKSSRVTVEQKARDETTEVDRGYLLGIGMKPETLNALNGPTVRLVASTLRIEYGDLNSRNYLTEIGLKSIKLSVLIAIEKTVAEMIRRELDSSTNFARILRGIVCSDHDADQICHAISTVILSARSCL